MILWLGCNSKQDKGRTQLKWWFFGCFKIYLLKNGLYHYNYKLRSSQPQEFLKKALLNNYETLVGKHLCKGLEKLEGRMLATLLEEK